MIPGRVPRALAGLAVAGALRAQAPTWESLERQGVAIAAVEVRVQNVFDLSDPAQDHWIAHLANALHVPSRDGMIRRLVLLRPGDRVDVRRIHEAERDLRAHRFLKDARIDPEVRADGSVAAVVIVRDAWTLKASVGYSHVGGQSTWGFGLRDRNLLGSGKDLEFRHDRGIDERSTTFIYRDPQLLGSRWTLVANYQALSDGVARGFDLARPFYTLDTPWAVDVSAGHRDATLRLYDREALAYAAPSRESHGSVEVAWRIGGGADEAFRLGFRMEAQDQSYGPFQTTVPAGGTPPDLAERRLRGPALVFAWLQDRFQVYRDLQGMDTPEDYNLGWSGSGVFGLYSRAWGSTGTGPFGRLSLSKGWAPGERRLVLVQASGAARSLDGRVSNALGNFSVTGYAWNSGHQVWAGNLIVDGAFRPDPESLLNLGGLDGMRGYPNFMHLGDRRWIASVEDRLLTDWRWLGMLRAGFVVFADAGAIRRLDGTGWTRTYRDLGGGLRFGDLKSSLGRVVLLTVAFPLDREPGLDRYQILVGNIVRF